MGSDIEHVDAAEIEQLRGSLLDWYREHSRSLPWRGVSDPYPILVAEVMSQQTQLDRVIEPFESFIARWPTVSDLAAANRSEVVTLWADHALGYNNRARYLHEAAQQVCQDYEGDFPTDPDELQQLMGVGPYTANAVASFAFDRGGPVIETNVRRVLYRMFDIPDEEAVYESIANELMPATDPGRWNNAIMELGGLACDKRPRCDEASCPWRSRCRAYREGDFSAPDVQSQSAFDGSQRQYRGRIVRLLSTNGATPLDEIGRSIRVDYGSPDADADWLEGIVRDLEADGIVSVSQSANELVIDLHD